MRCSALHQTLKLTVQPEKVFISWLGPVTPEGIVSRTVPVDRFFSVNFYLMPDTCDPWYRIGRVTGEQGGAAESDRGVGPETESEW